MRYIFLAIILFFSHFQVSKAQHNKSAEEQNVEKTVVGLFDGFSAQDADKIIQFCTPDVTILENGVIWNADTLRVKINPLKGRNIKRINTLDFKETHIRGNTAWTTYHNGADITVNGKPSFCNGWRAPY